MSLQSKTHVGLRIRPMTPHEKHCGFQDVLQSKLAGRIVLSDPNSRQAEHNNNVAAAAKDDAFTFTKIFGRQSTNHDIFEEYQEVMLSAVAHGEDMNVVVTGATGSGKSHLMFGQSVSTLSDPWKRRGRDKDKVNAPASARAAAGGSSNCHQPSPANPYDLEKGLLELIMENIFKEGLKGADVPSSVQASTTTDDNNSSSDGKSDRTRPVKVQMSMYQLFDERWTDLLDPTNASLTLANTGFADVGTFLDGLTAIQVNTMSSLNQLMNGGLGVRAVLQPQMVDGAMPLIVEFKVGDTHRNTFSVLRFIEIGAPDAASPECMSNDRLSEVQNVDRYWRRIQDIVNTLCLENQAAKSKAIISRLCQRSSLTFLLEDLLFGNLGVETGPSSRRSHYVILGCASPVDSHYQSTVAFLKVLDQIQALTETNDDDLTLDSEDEEYTLEHSSSNNKMKPKVAGPRHSTSNVLNAIKLEIERLKDMLSPEQQETRRPSSRSPKQGEGGFTLKSNITPRKSIMTPGKKLDTIQDEQNRLVVMQRIQGLESYLRIVQEFVKAYDLSSTAEVESASARLQQWVLEHHQCHVRPATWHRVAEMNSITQQEFLKHNSSSNTPSRQRRPSKSAPRHFQEGSVPPSLAGSVNTGKGSRENTPVSAAAAHRRRSSSAFRKDTASMPAHSLVVPGLFRIGFDYLNAGRVFIPLYEGRNILTPPSKLTLQDMHQVPEEGVPEVFHLVALENVVGSNPQVAHCSLTYIMEKEQQSTLMLQVEQGGIINLNGDVISAGKNNVALRHRDVLAIGLSHVFTLQHPIDCLHARDEMMASTKTSEEKDVNLTLDPYHTIAPNLEPDLSSLLKEARGVIIAMVDRPAIPKIENQPPELAGTFVKPSSTFSASVQRMHDVTLQVLRVKLVELLPLIEEANEIAITLQKPCSFEAFFRPHRSATPKHVYQTRLGPFPLVEVWILVKSMKPEVTDVIWHPQIFKQRLIGMREMLYYYNRTVAKDLWALRLAYPPNIDSFYDGSKEKLIGVGYCYLDSLLHMLEIHESLTVTDATGHIVGEIDLEVVPTIVSDNEPMIVAREAMWKEDMHLRRMMGKTLLLSFSMNMARNIPRRSCHGVFVSFRFYSSFNSLTTSRCPEAVCDPVWQETLSVREVVTEGLLDYLSRPLEIELYGQPEILVDDKQLSERKRKTYGPVLWFPALDDPKNSSTPSTPAGGNERGGKGKNVQSPLASDISGPLFSDDDEDENAAVDAGVAGNGSNNILAARKRLGALKEKYAEAKRDLKLQTQMAKKADLLVGELHELENERETEHAEIQRLKTELDMAKIAEEENRRRIEKLERELRGSIACTIQ